jgi:hypothetical protein
MNEKEYKWISVSSMAKLQGVSTQTIRNRIKDGVYETREFERGKMKGILVALPQ